MFDPAHYKRSTRDQWEDAAEAWHRWGPAIEAWLGPATSVMLDAAGVREGSRVLDVAAGTGGQSIAAARRTGPTGHVLATDIAPTILKYAAMQAADAGLANVETRELDGENLAVPAGEFDAVISRVGLIYFPDQRAALAGIRTALRDGGRLAAVVYSTADRNGFFSVPVGIIRRRAELPPPAPGQPGPFSLGGPGVAEQILADAGFRDIRVEAVPSPIRLANAAECARFERESFGALHQMLAGLPETERSAAWTEVEDALRQFDGPDGFTGPCEMLVISAAR
ncbi:class I SAM-dependent methyltransferase [Actinoplanes solisilvae]|uniref:class I SAM-dependent methyltransferase n=1 Tax=Actinoplanes solisilvae TaxID=2486853 RepID=UPI000FD73EE0|nr:class I SAM-dependent methyltransferase [Actinoplanes solisilvae]